MDKVESPAISLHIYGKLICDTGTKMIKLTTSYLMVLGKKKKKRISIREKKPQTSVPHTICKS